MKKGLCRFPHSFSKGPFGEPFLLLFFFSGGFTSSFHFYFEALALYGFLKSININIVIIIKAAIVPIVIPPPVMNKSNLINGNGEVQYAKKYIDREIAKTESIFTLFISLFL